MRRAKAPMMAETTAIMSPVERLCEEEFWLSVTGELVGVDVAANDEYSGV